MCSIHWYFVCWNHLYTFITGDPVKQYMVHNIIVEKLLQPLIYGTITKCCKCLIKVNFVVLLVLPAIFAIPYSRLSSSILYILYVYDFVYII